MVSRLIAVALAFCLTGTCFLPSTGESATHDVSVRNFVFVPANLTIQQGDIVRWSWVEGMHTTTSGPAGSPDGLWDAPINLSNLSFQRTFNDPLGTYPYFCQFHFLGGMTGSITVQAAPNNPPNVINPGTQNGTEGVFFSVTVNANDGDGDPLTMTDQGTTPLWATFVDNGDNTATISGTPAPGEFGTYSQTVRAFDGVAFDEEIFDIVIAKNPIIQVELTSAGFVPADVIRETGQSVQWIKNVGGQHTTTSGTGPTDPNAGLLWDAPLTNASPSFVYQFTSPGIYSYFCSNHPTDTGTVTVNDTITVGIGDSSGKTIRRLQPPFPNPFSSKVGLVFNLERSSRVRVHIFSIDGRNVRTLLIGEYPAGEHEVIWEGRDNYGKVVASGMYFVRLETPEGTSVRKMFKAR